MIGVKNKDDIPIKKPRAIAIDLQTLGIELSCYQCDNSHEHVQGRGQDLKATERYTFVMTDLIHSVFRLAAFQARTSVPAIRIAMTEGMLRGPPQETANILASYIPVEERHTVYQRVLAWEERLKELRASCLAVAFEDGFSGAPLLGGSQQPVDIVLDCCLCTDSAKQFRSYKNVLKLFESVPRKHCFLEWIARREARSMC